MLRYLLIFAVLLSSAYCDFENIANALVDDCVNAITGDLYLKETDIVAEAKEPLMFNKTYLYIPEEEIKNAPNTPDLGLFLNPGWSFYKHLQADIGYYNYEKKTGRRLYIFDSNGTGYIYDFEEKHKKKKYLSEQLALRKECPDRLNMGRIITNAQSNQKNFSVERTTDRDLKVITPEKITRNYHRDKGANAPFFLKSEELLNGNTIYYSYDKEKRLSRIESKSKTGRVYGSFDITYFKGSNPKPGKKDSKNNREDNGWVYVKTHTGKQIDYHFKKRKPNTQHNDVWVLNDVEQTGFKQHLDYHQAKEIHFPLKEYDLQNDRKVSFETFMDKAETFKVKLLRAPAGKDTTLHSIHTFDYHFDQRFTIVKDAYDNQTVYRYSDKKRLEQVEKYQKIGEFQVLHDTELLALGSNGSSQEGFLHGKVFFNENNEPIKAYKFSYDDQGNLLQESLYGQFSGKCQINISLSNNLPTDNGVEKSVKCFAYNENNLITKTVDENGLVTEISYLPKTNLISSKFIKYQDKIKLRTFYEYNQDNILIKVTEDNGTLSNSQNIANVTARKIKVIKPTESFPFGLIDTLGTAK
ncbi:MAG: hypothetical protein HZB76_01725 [Chlamydiae bacterium]|nr:hypothetical protein [Chlamydiota bacterium]